MGESGQASVLHPLMAVMERVSHSEACITNGNVLYVCLSELRERDLFYSRHAGGSVDACMQVLPRMR